MQDLEVRNVYCHCWCFETGASKGFDFLCELQAVIHIACLFIHTCVLTITQWTLWWQYNLHFPSELAAWYYKQDNTTLLTWHYNTTDRTTHCTVQLIVQYNMTLLRQQCVTTNRTTHCVTIKLGHSFSCWGEMENRPSSFHFCYITSDHCRVSLRNFCIYLFLIFWTAPFACRVATTSPQ